VKVHTDGRPCRPGEATISGLCREKRRRHVAAIRGKSPAAPGKEHATSTRPAGDWDFLINVEPFTKAAVEMALWTSRASTSGCQFPQLLGCGKVRDRVRIKKKGLVVGRRRTWVTDEAEQPLALGGVVCERESGPRSGDDIARVRAVREVAGPEHPRHDRRQ